MANEQTVKVDGIVLTRTQVEKALKELNKPRPKFKAGDLVQEKTQPFARGVVVAREGSGWLSKEANRRFGPIYDGGVRFTDGVTTIIRSEMDMIQIGSLAGL